MFFSNLQMSVLEIVTQNEIKLSKAFFTLALGFDNITQFIFCNFNYFDSFFAFFI